VTRGSAWQQAGATLSFPAGASHAFPINNSVVHLTLFVAGDTYRSQRAIANLRRLGDERLAGRYQLVVVDVRDDPQAAESERILTTPTLIKRSPGTPRRVTGDLIDFDQVLMALSLTPGGEA
jgi:circadian clock protein KaiB